MPKKSDKIKPSAEVDGRSTGQQHTTDRRAETRHYANGRAPEEIHETTDDARDRVADWFAWGFRKALLRKRRGKSKKPDDGSNHQVSGVTDQAQDLRASSRRPAPNGKLEPQPRRRVPL